MKSTFNTQPLNSDDIDSISPARCSSPLQSMTNNFAGTIGINNRNLKKIKNEMNQNLISSYNSRSNNFQTAGSALHKSISCTRTDLIQKKRDWSRNLDALDKIEYVNSDSRTKLVGYFAPANGPNGDSSCNSIADQWRSEYESRFCQSSSG